MDINATYEDAVRYLSDEIMVSSGSFVDSFTEEELLTFYKIVLTKQKLIVNYRILAYILGTIIIISNLIVLISSGLIIRKGQRPKSTYLLLGNVSLADTMIGISMISIMSNRTNSSSPWCNLQIGLLICPTLVSVFSVGLIAIDRYIFILHGLYYHRWFNTTRVRIGIICTWIVGMILGFMPITGWKNTEMRHIKCYYFSLFPSIIIIINGLLSIIPILIVAILNMLLLVHALRNVELLKGNHYNKNTSDNKLRKFRGPTIKYVNETQNKQNTIKKSASFDSKVTNINTLSNNEFRSKSLNALSINNKSEDINKSNSDISFHTLASSVQDIDLSTPEDLNKINKTEKTKPLKRYKEPSKWRAIIVVTLTSGSFLITWLPYFMTLIIYELCEHKFKSSRCIDLRFTLRGPLGLFGYFNSVLNPLIYAWWHKGFKRFLKNYYLRLYRKSIKK